MDDAIEWAKKEAGIGFRESPKGGIYLSQVVVQTSASLPTAFKALQAIAARISSTLSAAQNMPAEVSGFQLQSDPAEGAGWTYRFERRVGRPFADQTFFSSAPLQTGDHLKLLEQMEADFSQS